MFQFLTHVELSRSMAAILEMPQYVAYQKNVAFAFMKLSAKSHSFNILCTMDGLSCPTTLTWTGLKNCKFYGPDPEPTWLYFLRTGLNQNNLAPTQNKQVSDYSKHVNTPYNEVITLYDMLIKENNHSTCSVKNERHVFNEGSSLSPKFQEKMSHTLVKNTPTRTDPK